MVYATVADIVQLYGQQLLDVIADRDGDGQADAGVVDQALIEASSEIDLYVGARHDLPLPEIPAPLRRMAIDIAVYRMASDGAARTDEQRQRYEDAVQQLKDLSTGKARLSFSPDPNADPNDPLAGQGPRPIVTTGPPRIFSRDKMRGL